MKDICVMKVIHSQSSDHTQGPLELKCTVSLVITNGQFTSFREVALGVTAGS